MTPRHKPIARTGRVTVVVPAKRLDDAKRRLAGALPDADRRALVEALLADVLAAVRCLGPVDVLVVTDEPRARPIADAHGARVLAEGAAHGHNAALRHGIAHAQALGAPSVICLSADCPLVDPAELEAMLRASEPSRTSVVLAADRHGAGTNALLLDPADALQPSFGARSLVRHRDAARRAGADTEVLRLRSLALDVDTPDDLAALKQRLADEADAAPFTRSALQIRHLAGPSPVAPLGLEPRTNGL